VKDIRYTFIQVFYSPNCINCDCVAPSGHYLICLSNRLELKIFDELLMTATGSLSQ